MKKLCINLALLMAPLAAGAEPSYDACFKMAQNKLKSEQVGIELQADELAAGNAWLPVETENNAKSGIDKTTMKFDPTTIGTASTLTDNLEMETTLKELNQQKEEKSSMEQYCKERYGIGF